MDRGLAMTDDGAAQILGFIVGLAVVTGSLAIATYFITTTPETSSNQESDELQGDTHRSIETLTRTPGEPRDWEDKPTSELRRFGLLLPNKPHYASLEKIQQIQEGNITEDRILQSWDMNTAERGLRIEGRIQSVPIGDAPGVESYGVVQSSDGDPPYVVSDTSRAAAERFAKANTDYEAEIYDWKFKKTSHPRFGTGTMGDTFLDHAYFIETFMIPKMAGLAGTFHLADHGGEDWYDPTAARDAVKDYRDDTNSPISSTSWRVVVNGTPYALPGHNDKPGDGGEHALTINFRRDNGNDKGLGLWRVQDGARSVAVLPSVSVDDAASSANLRFDQLLKVSDTDSSLEDCTSMDQMACTMIRPSILFWNNTKSEWTRLTHESKHACNTADTWDDFYDNMSTGGGNWDDDLKVDLCEALEHSSGEMDLAFFWDSSCRAESTLENTTCTENNAVRSWTIDDVEVQIDGETRLHRDFEPPKGLARNQLFVSSGVDHNRTYSQAPDHLEKNTMLYLRHMVENGTSAVAMYPHESHDSTYRGDWLSQLGLSATGATPDGTVDTVKPSSIVMKFPNGLPKEADDYIQDESIWKTGSLSGSPSWPMPSDFQQLPVVQEGPDGGFLLQGEPYPDGGRVVALARNDTQFANESLRADLYQNMQGSAIFIDPSFTIGPEDREAHLPDPGSAEIVTDRRVLLVTVTPDERYVMPLEVTVWLWERH